MEKILVIISLIISWNSAIAQCLSQAGEISTTVSSPGFCFNEGGTIPIDIAYPTAPVATDGYGFIIIDDATETIQTLENIGVVNTPSIENVDVPNSLAVGTYKVYGINVDFTDPEINVLYPGGVGIIGSQLTDLIGNIENLGGVSATGDICGDITTTFVSFEIFALPIVAYTALTDLCISAGEVLGNGGGTPIGGAYSGAGVTDDGNGMTYSFNTFTSLNGVKTLAYTFIDINGCKNSFEDDVEVFTLPTVSLPLLADVCIGATELTGETGGSPTGGVYSGTGVTDDGNGSTYSFDPGAAGAGIHLVTYTYVDGNGCTGNSSNNIEVGDNVLPTAVCQDVNVYLDGSGSVTIVAGDIDGGSVDNCGAITLGASQTSFTCANIGVNNVTLTVTDGSTNSSNCDALVTVIDTISPSITCPGNQTETPDVSCHFTLLDYTSLVSAVDNCGVASVIQTPIAGTVINGTTGIIMTATDFSGNEKTCSFDVVLADVTPPTAFCQNMNATLDVSGSVTILASELDGGSIDNCAGLSFSVSTSTFTCADLGPNNVILTVTDGALNSTTCPAIVNVFSDLDVIDPTASNPVDINVECAGDIPISNINVVTDAMDNCGAPMVTFVSDVSDGLSCPETITRTYNVADRNGNSIDVVQSIIIMDLTPPTASNIATVSVQCIADIPTENVDDVDDEADNCGTPTVTFIGDVTDGNNCPETITRTYRVTDGCGNSLDVEQLIVVNDNIIPVPDLAVIPSETFICTTLPQAPTATDNCSGTITGVSDLVLPITTFGATTITWTYTDNCGNSTTQTQDVMIDAMDVSTVILSDGITISASNTGASYRWIDCGTNQPINGETGSTFTPTYNGSFAVEITKGNCFDVSECVTISTVSLETVNIEKSFVISPNPTSSSITISSGTPFNKVEVVNTLGQKVAEYKVLETSNYSLTLPDENGVYLVKVYDSQSIMVKRVVKK